MISVIHKKKGSTNLSNSPITGVLNTFHL